MDLLEKIRNCSEDELDSVLSTVINEKNNNSNKIEKLGFLNNTKANCKFFGFIPLDARIKYSSIGVEDYSMKTTDFLYEFGRFVKKYDISNKAMLIHSLESFINNYFGINDSSRDLRASIFNDIAWNNTKTDEEYFEALENNEIGALKGKGVALCTERSAVAQQILSLYDIESYYCMGSILHNDGDRECSEAHCFNIVKRKNDYAIVDYSMPVTSYKEGKVRSYYPFVGVLSNEEFEDFISNQSIRSFNEYNFKDGEKNIIDNKNRKYVVGSFEISKDIKNSVTAK